jgi:hypothetical protein
MSNYPNMSYCMNENTLSALKQVLDTMQEEGPAFLLEMSREERRAFQELFNACEDFLTASEELQEQVEDMEQGFNDYDGQPDEAQEWESFDPDC